MMTETNPPQSGSFDSLEPAPDPPRVSLQVRCVCPSLLDWRFAGDPWIQKENDGSFALCLGNYPLANIGGIPLDLPSLNHLLERIRQTRPRQRRS